MLGGPPQVERAPLQPPPITFTPLPPPATPQPPSPTASLPLTIERVTLGNAIGPDHRIQGVAGKIAPHDVVYLSVETAGAGDAMLKSRWTYHRDGKSTLVKEESQHAVPGTPVAFHAERAAGWPKGDYQVELFVNGTSAARHNFTVG